MEKIIRDKNGRFVKGVQAYPEYRFKKGEHISSKTEFTSERMKGNRFQLNRKNYHHSQETINKIIRSRRENNSYRHTKETREKISINTKKGMDNPTTKQKLKEMRTKRIFPMKDTQIELKIQNFLTYLHIEYLTHKYISEITHAYQCDILIPSTKTIIECDGCFYHNCPICKFKEYNWNKERKELDQIRTQELIDKGFRVIRLWEHDIKAMEPNILKKILKLEEKRK